MNTPSALRRSKDVTRWNLETDVLVAGLGCAGASAALDAVAAGAEVTVVERASAGGGTSSNSGGVIYLGGGTPIQKECGFDDTSEEMAKYLLAACGTHRDEAKIRAYSDDSVEQYQGRDGVRRGDKEQIARMQQVVEAFEHAGEHDAESLVEVADLLIESLAVRSVADNPQFRFRSAGRHDAPGANEIAERVGFVEAADRERNH